MCVCVCLCVCVRVCSGIFTEIEQNLSKHQDVASRVSMELLQSFPAIKKLCLKPNTAPPAAAACAGFYSCAGFLLTSNQSQNQLVLKLKKRFGEWTVQH